jgi:hypothetical protein
VSHIIFESKSSAKACISSHQFAESLGFLRFSEDTKNHDRRKPYVSWGFPGASVRASVRKSLGRTDAGRAVGQLITPALSGACISSPWGCGGN